VTNDSLKIDRPVRGDVRYTHRGSVKQYTPAEFLAEIDRALETPGVVGLVWDQYTPYFNDGDPCEFGINEVRALVDDEDTNEGSDYGRGLSASEFITRTYERRPNGRIDYSTYTETPREIPGVEDPAAIADMLRSLSPSAWEDVALSNFGDHAEVTATKDGFSVEYYEHD
jgi:hypothetical protein